MSKNSWLHLSDLHLGKELYNEAVVLEDIQNQINTNHINLDFVFITGDITYFGKPKEFEVFLSFIDKLLAVTNLEKDNIILVPGNHDVNRSDIHPLLKTQETYKQQKSYFGNYWKSRTKNIYKRIKQL